MIQAKMLFDNDDQKGSSSLPAGIHYGVHFSGIVKDQFWWDILFTSPEGGVIRKRLFDPKGTFPMEGESPEDALQRELDSNLKHIVKVSRVVIGDEESDVEAPDYHSLIQTIAEKVNKSKGKLVNLKVIMSRRRDKESGGYVFYPDLGNYPNYIEEYRQDTTLKFTKKELERLEEAGVEAGNFYYTAPDGLPF